MNRRDIRGVIRIGLSVAFACGALLCGAVQAANRYAVASGNWNATSTWSASSGGASGASVPVAGDTAFIGEATVRTVTIPAGITASATNVTLGNATAVNGPSQLTLAAATSVLNVSGAVTVNAPNNNNITNALAVNAGTVIAGGALTLNGGNGNRFSELLISTGTATLGGNLSVTNARSRVTFSGAGALNLAGNFNNGGTFTRSTGSVTYNGASAQNVGAYTYNNLIVNKVSGSASLTANTPVAGNLTVTAGTLDMLAFTANRTAAGGVLTVANTATLRLSASNFPSNNYTVRTLGPTSTVNYYGGGAQTVSVQTYGHLSLGGGGTKTPAAGTTTITGNFTLASGVTYAGTTSNPTVNLAGNFNNGGTFNSGSGIYTFNGATTQTITGATTFRSLTINKTAATPNNQVILNNDLTLGAPTSGTLRLTNGVIVTGAYKVIITSTGTVTRTNGHVAGNLQKTVVRGANITRTFEIGDATTYRPVTLRFTSVTAAGSVIAASSQTAGDHGAVGSGIDTTRSVNRYWTLTNVGTAFTNYTATFTFVAGDIDAGATPSLFLVKRYAASVWSSTTAGPTTPTSTQASLLTGFGDFAIGQAGSLLSNFLITVGSTSASTCVAKNIAITARDAANATLTSYTGTISLSTSTANGNWSRVIANGTLTPGAADSGSASYTFVGTDNGSITLALSDGHVEDASVIVQAGTVNNMSSTLNFRVGGTPSFTITPTDLLGATVVAGRGHAFSASLQNTCATNTAYTGSKALKTWITRDVIDPGGVAPVVGGQSLPNAAPGVNITLSFSGGIASFTLDSTDVGKYTVSLRDDSLSFADKPIDGTSGVLTVRPFGIGFSNIRRSATNNPGGANSSDAIFIAAGQTFAATVGAYRWQGVDDVNNDGLLDGGVDITDNALTVSFAWPVSLTAVLNTPSGGVIGTIGGTNPIAQASFSGGAATIIDLSYSEVGSMRLAASTSNYLNSAGVNPGGNSVVVGRFTPNNFTVSYNTPEFATGCAAGAFTYLGKVFDYTAGRAPVMTISARSASTGTPITKNYSGAFWKLTNSTLTGRSYTAGSGTLDAAGLPPTTTDPVIVDTGGGVFTSVGSGTGTLAFSAGAGLSFARTALTAPFDAEIKLAITIRDADGVALTANPASFGDTSPGNGIAFSSGKEMRFGRLALRNAYGSELIELPLSLTAEYYADLDGAGVGADLGFVINSADNCTAIIASDVTITPNAPLLTGDTTLTVAASPLINGSWHASAGGPFSRLSKPTSGQQGSVDVAIDLDAVGLAWLKYDRDGVDLPLDANLFDDNPGALAVFGIYQDSARRVYLRERFN